MGKKNILRILYAVMYCVTSMINLMLALKYPEMVRGLADTALIPLLGRIISSVPESFYALSLFMFCAYQITLVILLLSKGIYAKLGIIGAIVFHIGILPFGLFNLPNIIFALPLIFLLKKEFDASIPEIISSKFQAK